jgi:hypothetical protein
MNEPKLVSRMRSVSQLVADSICIDSAHVDRVNPLLPWYARCTELFFRKCLPKAGIVGGRYEQGLFAKLLPYTVELW